MTDTAGPFDGTPWAEAQWARHAAAWAPSGVYGPPGASSSSGDLPLSLSALNAGLGAGRAWVRGFGFERSGAAVMQTVTANTHATFQRRDRIVLRRNLATHTVTPVIITGTPSGTPTAPALTQNETGSWDLPMFSFLVPPGSGTSITGIVDERGWITASGGLEVPSIAVRDAHFPSPFRGQACTVLGNPHTFTGTAWKFTLSGRATGTTDSNGVLFIPYDPAAPEPTSVQLTAHNSGDFVNQRVRWAVQSTSASTLQARAVDSVPNTYWGNAAMTVNWEMNFG